MNNISVRDYSSRPVDDVRRELDRVIREIAPRGEAVLRLRAPFDVALRVGVTLERQVVVRFAPISDQRGAYAVSWQADSPGPFPAFSGTLTADLSRYTLDLSVITLEGHYHPPLGVAGDVFNAIIGRHIARASAQDVVERLVARIESSDAVAA